MRLTYTQYRRMQLPLGAGCGIKLVGLNKPKRINASPLEWQEAERLTRWRDEQGVKMFPELAYLHAIPNGGFRHKIVAAKMKAQGVLPGAPDFYLDVARRGFHGLRIELKRRSGGKVSHMQSTWISWLNSQGYLAVVCVGWEEARYRLIDYLSSEVK